MLDEIAGLDVSAQKIRIPDQIDVPISDRVRRTIDTPAFRRLARISQLGLVGHVYPAAGHSRFEHSLGVYRMVLLVLRTLGHQERFRAIVSPRGATRLAAAALLHDIGHWPFCHPIEDLRLPGTPRHEALAAEHLTDGPLADVLRSAWSLEPEEVLRLLVVPPDATPEERVLASLLSGPIDVDKLDYLYRDSLHCGVPYGRNFDQGRLIGSLTLDEAGHRLAITHKGRTPAEMMVFARYVMFSEVYWHHAVRSATAMFQRAFYRLMDRIDTPRLRHAHEADVIEHLGELATGTEAARLLGGLFGPVRELFKRAGGVAYAQDNELFFRLARQPYPLLVRISEHLAEILRRRTGQAVPDDAVLIDAPPVKLEVQFAIDVADGDGPRYRPLGELSPVVKTLALEQFDLYVKRVRVFVAPELLPRMPPEPTLHDWLREAIDEATATSPSKP